MIPLSLLETEGDLCAKSSATADKLWPDELLIAVTFSSQSFLPRSFTITY